MSDFVEDNKFCRRTCDEWADLLALTPEEQLPPVDRAAFLQHVQSCANCANIRTIYPLITAYARRSLTVKPLSKLPPVSDGMQESPSPPPSEEPVRPPRLSFFDRENLFRERMGKLVSFVAAACVVFGFLLLYNATTNVAHS